MQTGGTFALTTSLSNFNQWNPVPIISQSAPVVYTGTTFTVLVPGLYSCNACMFFSAQNAIFIQMNITAAGQPYGTINLQTKSATIGSKYTVSATFLTVLPNTAVTVRLSQSPAAPVIIAGGGINNGYFSIIRLN